jgi:hypothetical protein
MDKPDMRVDNFEIFRMREEADHRLIKAARALVERYGLDPELTDDAEEAVRGNDRGQIDLAFARLLEAVIEVRGMK